MATTKREVKQSEVTGVLVKALERFEGGKRWTRGTLYDKADDTVCALGAIGEVCGDAEEGFSTVPEGREAVKLLASVIRVQGNAAYDTSSYYDAEDKVPEWNDERKSFRTIKNGFCRAVKKSMELEKSLKGKRKKKEKE